jgi:hypothetical protein
VKKDQQLNQWANAGFALHVRCNKDYTRMVFALLIDLNGTSLSGDASGTCPSV